MAYRLVPFTPEWETAVERSNARLRASGLAPFYLPERAIVTGTIIRREHQLAVDETGEVRGGCLFQRHNAWIDGESASALNLQSPLSEGLFDAQYAGIGPWMVREALRQYPYTYCVGMGGLGLPFPRLLKALRWRVEPVPFYFRVLAGDRFLAQARVVRAYPRFGPLVAMARAIPCIPNFAAEAFHRLRKSPPQPAAPALNAAWVTVRTRYGFAIERAPEVLDALYPPTNADFDRVQVPGGLAVLRTTSFAGHKHFGDLRVSTLVEAICEPTHARSLVSKALTAARARQADLLVSNQSAPEIADALSAEGWLHYTSNYLIGLSPALMKRVGKQPIYVNRGDGDGLLNL